MKQDELVHMARLEGVYAVARKLQATHNEFDTRCIGTGNCCRIGLIISLGECWNIAKRLREEYWKTAEASSLEDAERWWDDVVNDLKTAMSWDWNADDGGYVDHGHCVFYKDGCGIYGYRPFICRAYGVIAPVQEGHCPRKRLPDGGHELIRNKAVDNLISEFDAIISQWGKDNPTLDFSIYMPAGILRFLLPDSEFKELVSRHPDKFMGHTGYQHQLKDPSGWQSVEIRSN